MICWVPKPLGVLSGSGSPNTCSLSHRLSLAPTLHLMLSLVVLPQCWHLHYAATSLQLSLQFHQRPPLVSHSVKSQFLSRTFSVLHLLCSPKSCGIPTYYQVLLPAWDAALTSLDHSFCVLFLRKYFRRFHLNKFWSLANQSQLIFEPQQTSTHCSSKAKVSLVQSLN